VSHKFSFHLRSEDRRRALPPRIIIGRNDPETGLHVTLKFLAYLLFFRDRLQIQPSLHNDSIPFTPDLVQLDYELRPALWVECGECGAAKLDKLAVKMPDAEIWIVKRSLEAARQLLSEMAKQDLRRNRYHLLALDEAMVTELLDLLRPRNAALLVAVDFEEHALQLDFNGLWFDASFDVLRF
jgi:uncharacterized protein YaeQ